MKLKEGFMTHESDGEFMVVATGEAADVFNGLIRNNKTADFIYTQLMSDTTVEDIVEKMAEKYDAPKEQIKKDIEALVSKLRKAGFLDE